MACKDTRTEEREDPARDGAGRAWELLSRDQIEAEYRLGRRWLELAALTGDGPPMIRISRRMVRYRRGSLEDWLAARTVSSTSDQLREASDE